MEIIAPVDAAEWGSWLAAHHAERQGVWLKIAKKGSGEPSVAPAQAHEVALLRLDRQPAQVPRREVLPAEVHARRTQEIARKTSTAERAWL